MKFNTLKERMKYYRDSDNGQLYFADLLLVILFESL